MDAYVREYIRSVEAFGWEGGPEFNTKIQPMANKREKRNAQWSQSRFFASLPFNNILPGQYENILSMFEDRLGRWGAFLYQNPNPLRNYANDVVFAVAEAGQTEFQLAALTTQGGRERLRRIYAIYRPDVETGDAIESEVAISVNGSPASSFDLNHDDGIIQVATSPGDVLAWSGNYSHWVRFDQDRLPFSIDNKSGDEYVHNGSVELIEVSPPKPGTMSSSS